MLHATIFGQLHCISMRTGMKRKEVQLFPRDHPGMSLHLRKYKVVLIISFGFTQFPSFCFLSGSSPYRFFSSSCLRNFSHVLFLSGKYDNKQTHLLGLFRYDYLMIWLLMIQSCVVGFNGYMSLQKSYWFHFLSFLWKRGDCFHRKLSMSCIPNYSV